MELCICKYSKFKEVTSSDVITDKSLSNMLQRTIQVLYVVMATISYGHHDDRWTIMRRCYHGST